MPVHALAAGAGKTPTVRKGEVMLAPGVAAPATTTPVSCSSQSYSADFWGYCTGGASGENFRTVSYCANDAVMAGWGRANSVIASMSDCAAAGNDSTMSTATSTGASDPLTGFVLCSAGGGAGTYAGYYEEAGDISSLLSVIGEAEDPGSSGATAITDGGQYLCAADYQYENGKTFVTLAGYNGS